MGDWSFHLMSQHYSLVYYQQPAIPPTVGTDCRGRLRSAAWKGIFEGFTQPEAPPDYTVFCIRDWLGWVFPDRRRPDHMGLELQERSGMSRCLLQPGIDRLGLIEGNTRGARADTTGAPISNLARSLLTRSPIV